MKAIINGISIEGTPQEILEYQRLQGMKNKLPEPKPWINPFQWEGSDGITNQEHQQQLVARYSLQYQKDYTMV